MDKIFLTVLNMTFTASFVIAAIIIARLFLKKAPKIISYIIWAAAGFRLIFPFSIESMFSFIRFNTQPIPTDIITQSAPKIDTGITFVDNAVNNILPAAPSVQQAAAANPLQMWAMFGTGVWITGIAFMMVYSVVSIFLLKDKLDNARHDHGNIYEVKNLYTPFVFGFLRPRIYLPADLQEDEKRYIIQHERTHIRRFDNLIKFVSYFILCLHWFNPLVWAAFILMSEDMEMSCDEHVLKELGAETKKAYSLSLLSLSAGRQIITGSPLAFGEGDTRKRIKNVLKFRNHSRAVIILSVMLAAVLTVGFTVNRVSESGLSEPPGFPEGYDIFQYAADTLTTLKIIPENAAGTENISRGELSLALSGAMTGTPEYFINNSAIEHLIENGLITELDWAANPGKTVEFQEAVKMFVMGLGHTGLSYPQGYMSKAREEDVGLFGQFAAFTFEGMPLQEPLTKNDAIMLLYNFLMSNFNKLELVWNGETGRYDAQIISEPVYEKFGITFGSNMEIISEQRQNNTIDYQPAADNPAAEYTPPIAEESSDMPAGFEEIQAFIESHHSAWAIMNQDKLFPEVNTRYILWKTYQFETALGATFEKSETGYIKMPVETVRNAVPYFYNLAGNSVQFEPFYINQDNPDYLWVPSEYDNYSSLFSIEWDTLNVNNNIYKFDVIFYNISPVESDRIVIAKFSYEFEQVIYKEMIYSYKFIIASNLN